MENMKTQNIYLQHLKVSFGVPRHPQKKYEYSSLASLILTHKRCKKEQQQRKPKFADYFYIISAIDIIKLYKFLFAKLTGPNTYQLTSRQWRIQEFIWGAIRGSSLLRHRLGAASANAFTRGNLIFQGECFKPHTPCTHHCV